MFHLREKFSQYGTITNVELKTNIGCGFVQFTTAEAADAACRGMDGQELLDQKIRVEPQRAGGARGPKTDGAKSSDGCFNCGSRGHWSKHCPNPPTGNFRGRGRGRGRGGYHSYDNRQHHGGSYDAYPPRRQEYHDPYARDPYAAPPPRDPYGHAGRDPYYQDPYARDPYAAAPPPPRDPYARADPYARDPYARDSYAPPRPQADPYYRDAPPAAGPPRDYYEPRDDGRQQYRRGGTPPQDTSYGRDVYAQPDPMRRRSRSPMRRGPPVQHDDYDYRYAPPQGSAADPYAAPDAYHAQGGPPAGGYADYDRTRGRSRSPQGGASGGGSYGYA
ncbi:hypothetical protein BCR37DRAFT_247182 [Protomyces lactucae-debilis]|uniref:CCHC-type domain-containing protein n=1 Tax=Protomyces lactucae-debilis TaxID=2754530 RepID=A0A1Y2FNX6_PROLT|nr:uncharacterized protein BCR37DRAFT_247182 [Protomyces lactucae-debilis]ORY85678.1 hypothetical protein BCR37DRAFT_247182 [Protomyces lactucae-debilis]